MGISSTIFRPLRWFIGINKRISCWINKVALRYTRRREGSNEFHKRILPEAVKSEMHVLDVGGGKYPRIDFEMKKRLNLTITGLDISREELDRAPDGAYDKTVVGDVAHVTFDEKFDLILSHTVLEHVSDNFSAFRNLTSALKPGGIMVHHLPSSNAWYVVINRILGNKNARRLLFLLYPERKNTSGFPAYYDHCTPAGMKRLCRENGLEITELATYYASSYLIFFAPLFLIDLLRQLVMMWLNITPLAETFTFVAHNPDDSQEQSGSDSTLDQGNRGKQRAAA